MSSLLPTASEKAEADRAKRALDNQKVSAFNREEITLAELEAYFGERLAQTADTVAKTEIQGLLDNARAADKKRKDAKIGNEAKDALADFQAGNASYEVTKEILENAKGRASDPELVRSIERLIKDAGQVNTQRDINTKIEDYNKGRMTYGSLAEYLDKQVAGTTNEVIRQQIVRAQDAVRLSENNKVITSAQEAYKAGRMTIEEFTNRLNGLRSDPRQKDPAELERISATIALAEANEQAVIDHQKFVTWQGGGMTDKEALEYFQGRLAVSKTAQSLETLGKYQANVKAKIDATQKSATSMAGRVASQASAEAKADLAAKRVAADKAFKDFDDNIKKMVEEAHGDPAVVTKLYALRAKRLDDYAAFVGATTQEYTLLKANNDLEATAMIAKYQWIDYEKDMNRITSQYLTPKGGTKSGQTDEQKTEGDELIGTNVSAEMYVNGHLALAARAREMEDNIYATPDQRSDARASRNAFLEFSKIRLEQADTEAKRAEGTLTGSLQAAWNDTNKEGVSAAQKIYSTWEAFERHARQNVRGTLSQVYLANNPEKTAEDADRYVQGVVATMHVADENRTTFLAETGKDTGGDDFAGVSDMGKLKIAWLKEAYPNSFGQLGVSETDERRQEGSLVGRRGTHDPVDDAFEQPFMGAEKDNDPNSKFVIFDHVSGFPSREALADRSPLTNTPVPTHDEAGRELSAIERAFVGARLSLGDNVQAAIRNAQLNAQWWDNYIQVTSEQSRQDSDAIRGAVGSFAGMVGKEISLLIDQDLQNANKFFTEAEEARNKRTEELGKIGEAGATVGEIVSTAIGWQGVSKWLGTAWGQFRALAGGVAGAEPEAPAIEGAAGEDARDRRLAQPVIQPQPETPWFQQVSEVTAPPPLFSEITAGEPWEINTPVFDAPAITNPDERPWWETNVWTPPQFDVPEWTAAPIEGSPEQTVQENWTPPTFELPDFDWGGGSSGQGGDQINLQQ